MTGSRARHSHIAFIPITIAVVALLIAPLAGVLAAPQAFRALVPTSQEVTVTTERLNVRSGPGLGYPVVRVVHRGDVFFTGGEHVSADGYSWSTMNVPDRPALGWVADQYVTTDPTGGGAVDGAFAVGDRVVTTTRLNFRVAPGTSAGVIRGLANGSVLTLTGGPVSVSGYTWYQGRTTQATGADTGWVIQDGLTLADAALPDPGLEFSEGSTVHVATDSLRLRAAPGTSAAIVARLGAGITLTVTGAPVGADGYSWYPVFTAAGASGWVASDYLAPGAGSGGTGDTGDTGGGDTAIVDTPRLNLRAGPGTDQGVIAVLSGGTTVTLIEGPVPANGYQWYRAETDGGAAGWVIGEALAR
jgi:N-acetylmuramoyl-L-alanine amidase